MSSEQIMRAPAIDHAGLGEVLSPGGEEIESRSLLDGEPLPAWQRAKEQGPARRTGIFTVAKVLSARPELNLKVERERAHAPIYSELAAQLGNKIGPMLNDGREYSVVFRSRESPLDQHGRYFLMADAIVLLANFEVARIGEFVAFGAISQSYATQTEITVRRVPPGSYVGPPSEWPAEVKTELIKFRKEPIWERQIFAWERIE